MFKKNSSEKKGISGRFDSVIGTGTVIEGNINFKSGLRIDGKVAGDLTSAPECTDALAVGPEGFVEGNIHAGRVIVAGSVKGSIHCASLLELLPGANVMGEIHYASISIAVGAKVSGSMIEIQPAKANSRVVEIQPSKLSQA